MSDESKSSTTNRDHPQPDPAGVSAQAAAIADHLQRSGVQWLPKPQGDVVESLRQTFAATAGQSAEATPSPTEAKTEAPRLTEPPNQNSVGQNSVGQNPVGQNPVAQNPVAQNPVAQNPAGQKTLLPVESAQQSYPGEPIAIELRQSSLDTINEQVKACERCPILVDCRTNTVFGEGSSSPRFVFFGEGPGADEDRSGRPFVGRAGQLLTKMIEACTLRREDVYILNTVKCRPPGNRNPEPDEIANCREYYQRQLAILRPEYIICLGAIGSQELLQNKSSVGRLRGSFHSYYDSKVLVTYHPAYLLRNPAAKRAAWGDLQLMMRDAGLKRN